MKKNDITALHNKTIVELEKQLKDLLVELAQARMKKAAGKLKNTHTALLSDDVARVKTVLSMKKKAEKAE
ncbi:MAG: hypothetical protein BroJett025_06940 [Patescibacteria group bacterium]|nr:MAG: hypothetical protein BroJett025_06940 [Patescibacteria group bacterium]